MSKDRRPTGSPISPVSPWVPSKEYFELERDLKRMSLFSGWRWFFWVILAALIVYAAFVLTGDRSQPPVQNSPSPTVSTPSVSPSLSTPSSTLPDLVGD